MPIQKPTSRSSLASHTIPPFYACYLLKSIRTPLSKATYIGSTPNPPRRIRQHNGEITQGAWKTKANRPWVMQMIIHGFPSKLISKKALQFEWAWQHPQISRHLRDQGGKAIIIGKTRSLATNIRVARIMLTSHPYNIWPLHVTLFSAQAVKLWNSVAKDVPPLPTGFICSIELEGVDGKSGQPGSGRKGPLSVNDEKFTSAFLAKNTALLASNRQLRCSICDEAVANFAVEPLSTSLCPNSSCTAVSHLLCLSKDFLYSDSTKSSMIPRGGHCRSCQEYILWGDIIKGSYRRSAGGVIYDPEDDHDSDDRGHMSSTGEDQDMLPGIAPVSKKRKAAAEGARRGPKVKKTRPAADGSEGELFDFGEVDRMSTTDDSEPSQRKLVRAQNIAAGKKQKNVTALPAKRSRPRTITRKLHTMAGGNMDPDDSGEFFDFDGVDGIASEDSDSEPALPPVDNHLDAARPSISLLGATSQSKSRFPRHSPLRRQEEQEAHTDRVDFFEVDDESHDEGDALVRVMSSLSVSSGGFHLEAGLINTAVSGARGGNYVSWDDRGEHEVIELSD